MEDFYVFLSSSDSINVHPKNNRSFFKVELLERIDIKDNWWVAIRDIHLSHDINENVYIYSDICNESFIDNSFPPILRY